MKAREANFGMGKPSSYQNIGTGAPLGVFKSITLSSLDEFLSVK